MEIEQERSTVEIVEIVVKYDVFLLLFVGQASK